MSVDSLVMSLGTALLVVVCCAPGPRESPGAAKAPVALVGGTIYPGPDAEPIRDGIVIIDSAVITKVGPRSALAVPDAATVLDCAGLTITAGFHNSHVHFFERKWADANNIPAAELGRQLEEAFTRYGFTTVFDTGSPGANTRAIRARIELGGVPGPRIRTTGEALVAPGAMPSDRILGVLGIMAFPAPEIGNDEQAVEAAQRLLDDGADGIKVHLQPPPPPGTSIPTSAIAAAVREAHEVGEPVFIHPHTGADVLAAARADVDVIAHTTPMSGDWDEQIIEAMKEHDVALTPTLTLWHHVLRHDRSAYRQQIVEAATAQLHAWVAVGGTVLFGTDLGPVGPDPREEYALMAEAGMTWRQILASLTTAPAQRFGDDGRLGRVEFGYEADLVVLGGDPAADIAALADVRLVLRAGRIVFRSDQ